MTTPTIVIRCPTEAELPDVFEMRYRLLREPWNQERGSERSPEDDTQTHLAVFEDDNKLVATARLDDLSNGLAQIRCVAVSPQCQGKGYGSKLMVEMERVAWEMGYTELTLHARVNAVMFYHRLGYTFISPSYNLWDQIQHYEMRKSKKVEETAIADGETKITNSGEFITNQSDQDFYDIIKTSLKSRGVDGTRALFELFVKDITKHDHTIQSSLTTTPTNDGKIFKHEAPK